MAVRWASDDFPGWIEFEVVDAEQRSHRVIEEVPVLTDRITAASDFPFELWLRAECGVVDGESAVIRFREGIATTDGLDRLPVDLRAIRWL